MTWDSQLYYPFEGMLQTFISLKSIALGWFEPANFGSKGKHVNHYTTEATSPPISEIRTSSPLPVNTVSRMPRYRIQHHTQPNAQVIHFTENYIPPIQTNSTDLLTTSFISTARCTFFQLLKNCKQHTKVQIICNKGTVHMKYKQKQNHSL